MQPEEKLLATYEDSPQSLHTFSNATPPEGVTATLVDVGNGTKPEDYEGKDVEGKFVLASGKAKLVHEQAVYKYGAAGVITDALTYEIPNVRESIDIPDAHAYQAIWPTARELEKLALGFSLSKRQGNYLRLLLQSGKAVKLRARINARLFPSSLEVVTATIRGVSNSNEEVFLVAHLCHPKPSCNDNASGSGLLLEIARTIKALIDCAKIELPARTIRFIWVPETFGTVAYIFNHEDLSSKLVAGINLDMVGQNQELCRSTLHLDRTPDSLPSYLNDYVFRLIEQSVKEFATQTIFGSSSTFRYCMSAFSGGSDHAEFTEATTRVPCVMMLQWPDLFYHTSMDTIDKVSEDSLKRVGWIATVAALDLANASVYDAFLFAHQAVSRGMTRIKEAGREAIEELFSKRDLQRVADKHADLAVGLVRTAIYYKNRIEHFVWREQEAVKSVRRLGESPELDVFLEDCCRDIVNVGMRETEKIEYALNFVARTLAIRLPIKLPETQTETELKRLIPRRLFKGTLSEDTLKQTLGEREYEWYLEIMERDLDSQKKMIEIVNFIDGKRSVHDIIKAVSAEYGAAEPEFVLKFLRDLEKTNFITF
jgi:hypothetical protein